VERISPDTNVTHIAEPEIMEKVKRCRRRIRESWNPFGLEKNTCFQV
jgi:hypothetical protein